MCRNIKPLHNFDPPATEDEIHAASLQFVRKISGTVKPSIANQPAFDQAVLDISISVTQLLNDLSTSAKPRNTEEEALQAKARSAKRFAKVN